MQGHRRTSAPMSQVRNRLTILRRRLARTTLPPVALTKGRFRQHQYLYPTSKVKRRNSAAQRLLLNPRTPSPSSRFNILTSIIKIMAPHHSRSIPPGRPRNTKSSRRRIPPKPHRPTPRRYTRMLSSLSVTRSTTKNLSISSLATLSRATISSTSSTPNHSSNQIKLRLPRRPNRHAKIRSHIHVSHTSRQMLQMIRNNIRQVHLTPINLIGSNSPNINSQNMSPRSLLDQRA